MRTPFTLGVCLLMTGACAAKRLPPGTPPPEYEIREPAPWVDPEAAGTAPAEDAGAAPAEDAAAPPNAVAPSPPPSENVPDASRAIQGPSPPPDVR